MITLRLGESKWVQTVENWLQLRSQKERFAILACAMVVCLFLWFSVWENMYQTSVNAFHQERQMLEDKIVSFKVQNKAMQTIINSVALAKKREQLTKDLKAINTQLDTVSTQLVSPKELSNALKNILSQTHGLELLSLSSTSTTLLTPDLSSDSTKDKGGVISNAQAATPGALIKDPTQLNAAQPVKLYQHEFTMEFEGDFFSVYKYLKRLENSPYRFYDDSLDYSVTEYPKAKIVLKLHTISKGKDLIND